MTLFQEIPVDPGKDKRPILENMTVMIPTLGRPLLLDCLISIAGGTMRPANIIIIDQGNNPSVEHWLGSPELAGLRFTHLQSEERSPASARNRGIDQAQTKFIAAIDDDCIVEGDWLEKMSQRLYENPGAIITGRLQPIGKGKPPTVVISDIACIYRHPSVRVHSPLASANMGFALNIAHQIGAFDKNLFAAEENDWAYRALRLGIPIMYDPHIIVHHVHWRDESQLDATYQIYAWCQGAFYGKHLREGDWSMLLRTGFSLFRGLREMLYSLIDKNSGRRADGYARITRLLPGLFAGLRGLGSPSP